MEITKIVAVGHFPFNHGWGTKKILHFRSSKMTLYIAFVSDFNCLIFYLF